jgi:galactonate dehydratase
MPIQSIDVFPVHEEANRRKYTALRITTTDGAKGWGEAPAITPEDLGRARSQCISQEVTRYDYLTRQFAGTSIAGALNIALLDLAAKSAGVPVHQFLGGPTRNKVRVLTPLPFPDLLDASLAAGHRAFTIPLRLPTAITPRTRLATELIATCAAVRKAGGEQVDFVADGLSAMPSAEAADIAVALEPLRPLWLDRPCRAESTDVLRRISEESTTPVGLGHDANSLHDIQNFLTAGVLDVVRLPLTTYGITPIRRAAALAETYYVAVAPVHNGGPIATAAALHLAASLPNFFIQEIPRADYPENRKLRDALTGSPIENVKDGYAALPTKPGLGIDVDETILRRMAQ